MLSVGGQEAVALKPPGSLEYAKTLPGIMDEIGFFDPLGFCSDTTEGKVRFYREVELKHGRVSMLAALGFLFAENFHPLFGGKIDVPSYIAVQETPLQKFWGAVVLAIAVPEIFSVFTFRSPFKADDPAKAESINPFKGETWSIRKDHVAGDFNFDPLDLKPTNPVDLKEMEMIELTNGRLAMVGIAGMVAQECVTGQKLFMLSVGGQEAVALKPPGSLEYAKTLPGIMDEIGFFDPLGFCSDTTEGKVRFYREVELKHGRVSMLAALGFLFAENFHPLFGGKIDVPS